MLSPRKTSTREPRARQFEASGVVTCHLTPQQFLPCEARRASGFRLWVRAFLSSLRRSVRSRRNFRCIDRWKLVPVNGRGDGAMWMLGGDKTALTTASETRGLGPKRVDEDQRLLTTAFETPQNCEVLAGGPLEQADF